MQDRYYVSMTDKFMSGWGHSKDRINKLVFICNNYDQAQIVFDNAHARTDQKNINICYNKPYYNQKRCYTQIKTIEKYPAWYKKDYFKK